MNLIDNAIKYRHPERPPVIEVSAERDGQMWHFRICDNGPGIPVDQAELAFSLFTRLHDQQQKPGTGIGLALCQKVIRSQGGRIWITEHQPHGCCMNFTLPTSDHYTHDQQTG